MTVNSNPIVQHVIQIKNGIMKHFKGNLKIIRSAKKIVVANLTHVFVRIACIQKVLLILE